MPSQDPCPFLHLRNRCADKSMLPISLMSEGCCKAQDERLYRKTKALFLQILGVFTVAVKLVVLVVHGGRVGVVSVTVHQQDGALPTGAPGPGRLWTQQRRAHLGTRVPPRSWGSPPPCLAPCSLTWFTHLAPTSGCILVLRVDFCLPPKP